MTTIEKLRSVKEALDTFPSAVGYYDAYGMLKLYNRRMASLYYQLAGEEVQDLQELKRRMEQLDPNGEVRRLPESPNHYRFPDDTVWKYKESRICMGENRFYTEVIFSEETQLYRKGEELKNQAAKLQKIAQELRQLSKDVLVLTKEEEVMAAKTRLHDEMGSALVAARACLSHPEQPDMGDVAIAMLRKAVQAIKNDNAYEAGRGNLAELLEDAEAIGLSIRFEGELAGDAKEQEVFLQAIRECMTNAVQHAKADCLQVKIGNRTITISNNGEPPTGEIVPRGGLLNLKHRVTALGGTMALEWTPNFRLTIQLSKAER